MSIASAIRAHHQECYSWIPKERFEIIVFMNIASEYWIVVVDTCDLLCCVLVIVCQSHSHHDKPASIDWPMNRLVSGQWSLGPLTISYKNQLLCSQLYAGQFAAMWVCACVSQAPLDGTLVVECHWTHSGDQLNMEQLARGKKRQINNTQPTTAINNCWLALNNWTESQVNTIGTHNGADEWLNWYWSHY